MGKICCRCKIEKDESAFGKNKRMKDGLHYICKECKRNIDNEWNADHREQRNEASKQWRKDNPDKKAAYYQRRKEFLQSVKTPCVKCGETRLTVIEFHHIDPATKLFNISYAGSNGSRSRAMICAELEKCVCLCANCHAEFHERYGHQPEKPVEMLDEYINL